MAYDAWGGSWGTSWALSWTGDHSPTPPTPPEPVIDAAPGGVGKGKSINLADFSDENARQRASEFIKAQLKLDQKKKADSVKALADIVAEQEKSDIASLAMKNMEIEAFDETRTILDNNNRLLIILMSS